MHDKELPYLLVLMDLPGIGSIRARELLRKYNSAYEVLHALKNEEIKLLTTHLPIISSKALQELLDLAYKEIEYMEENQVNYVFIDDPEYPYRLRHCVDAPIVLFYKGNINWNASRSISIVGTRAATNYGLDFCKELVADLKHLNVQIVSGLAYGIDIQAHKSAIEHGLETVACLGHGLHKIYPSSHSKYTQDILYNGGLTTEFTTHSVVDKKNFVRRNRIIAGLSQATIVVESAYRGGSYLTAEMANSYNREVFALPGRVDQPKSKGCNTLIKTEQARLIQSAADLVYILNWDITTETQSKTQQTALFIELSHEEEKICNILKEKNKISLDLLAIEADKSPQEMASILLSLELNGLVRTLPGKQFEWIG